MKTCSVCLIEKDDVCFSKDRRQCKECRKTYKQQLIKNNPEHFKQYNKIQNQNYPKDKKQLLIKISKEKNKEYYRKIAREYKINNREKINSKSREKYKNDPVYRLKRLTQKSILKAFKKTNSLKNRKSIKDFLPYTMLELRYHIESQFESWMNWENHGNYNLKTWDDKNISTWTWNIDHIIPQSKLSYTSMEDDNFKKCWALYNLRPYSAKQNVLDKDRKTNAVHD